MKSGRERFMDAQRVNLDGFAAPDASLGLVAMGAPADPVPSLVVAGGRIVEMDGVAEADFDSLDAFIARHGLDLDVAAETMALTDTGLARLLVDTCTPRAEVIRLAAGATPAKLARVLALLRPAELTMAMTKLRARRTPSNQAHVTNRLDDPRYDHAAAAIRGLLAAGTRVSAVLVASDEAVLVANRLPPAIRCVPLIDQVDPAAAASCTLLAVEVRPPGHSLTMLADPVVLGFLDLPAPAAAAGMLAVPGPGGLVPFAGRTSRPHTPSEWRAIRLRLKQAVLAASLQRALTALGEPGSQFALGSAAQLLLVGGPAADTELVGVLTRSLPGTITVGRGDLGATRGGEALGHRYAVALGLAIA